MVPSVIGADVIDRKVVEGVLHTHRLVVSTQWGFPKWTQAVSSTIILHAPSYCYVEDVSSVEINVSILISHRFHEKTP